MINLVKASFIPAILLVFLVIFGRPVLAESVEALYQNAQQAERDFFKSSQAQTYRHNWLNIIERYNRVIKANVNSRPAMQALLKVGDLYVGLFQRSKKEADLNEALDYYARLIKHFPRDSLAAEAQFKIGEVYYLHKKDKDRAFAEYLRVTLNFPQSNQAGRAQDRMNEISDSPDAGGKAEPAPAALLKPREPDAGAMALVKDVRQWSTPFYTRVVVDLDRMTDFKDHLLKADPENDKPMRLYLDLNPSRMAPDIKEVLPIPNQLLRQVRVAQYDSQTVRIVLDIESIQNYKIFALKDPFRIVIDMTGKEQEVAAQAESATESEIGPSSPPAVSTNTAPLTDLRDAANKRKKVPRGPVQQDSKETSLARQLGLGVRKIVIDPGHGGKDRGATGITGLLEKDVNLKIAKTLAAKIESTTDIKCILTRTKDVYMTLEERTAIANANQADLFVSIHCNTHPKASVHGIETYILDVAMDEDAMRVAARENATSTKHMSDLEVILKDLMLNSKVNESVRLARDVQKAMIKVLQKNYKNVRDMGVKNAPFYVLIGANMPSILIEVAFISNRNEEKRISGQDYMDSLADGIVAGIDSYAKSIKMTENK